MKTTLTTAECTAILAADHNAFMHEGHLVRVISDNDDDCGRDTVEIYEGGKWVSLIIGSLDWRSDLARTLVGHKMAA